VWYILVFVNICQAVLYSSYL